MRILCFLWLLSMVVWADETRVVGAIHSTTASNTTMTGKEYVEGAHVRLDDQEATSNEIGVFEFKKVVTGKHTLVVEKDGFVPARQEVTVEGGPLPFQIVVELTPRGPLGGGTVYVSCRSRKVIKLQTTQWLRGYYALPDADPLAAETNPPLDSETPHKLGDNPTTFDENVVMMLPEMPSATRLHKVADEPFWIAFTPNGKALYTSYNGRLEVADPVLHETLAAIPTEGTVGLFPCGSRMLATQMSTNPGVLLIDARTHTLERFVPTPGQPSGAWLDGDRLYVSLYDTGPSRLVCLSVASGAVLAETTVGAGALQVAPAGTVLLVLNSLAATVSVVDPTTLKVKSTIGVGVTPQRLAVSPDGRHALVTNRNSNTVSMLDLTTFRSVRTTRVGLLPIGVAYSLDGTRAWVACVGDGTVRVLDGRTGEQLHATNPMPKACPFAVAVKP